MINDDSLAKYSVKYFPKSWVDGVRFLKKRLSEMLSGFPGIGLNDLQINLDPKIGDKIFLWEKFDEIVDFKVPPILGKIIDISDDRTVSLEIEGFGKGPRDSREIGDIISINLNKFNLIIQLISTSKEYYFNTPRDFRTN